MANSKAILEQVKKDAARQRILTQVKKDAGLIKPTTETFKAEPVATPDPKPQPAVKSTGIIPKAMADYQNMKKTIKPTYVDENLNRKELKSFEGTTLKADNNSYRDFAEKNKGIEKKLKPDQSLAEMDYFQKNPVDQKKFYEDKNTYELNKKLEEDKKWAGHPINVLTKKFLDSSTASLFKKGMEEERNKQMERIPLYALEMEEAERKGIENNPLAATIGTMAGYAYPTGIASKVLKPVTNAVTKRIASPILKNVAEGAIIGAPIDAAQTLVETGDIKKVPKAIAEGAAIGAGVDVLLGGIGKGIKSLRGIDSIELPKVNIPEKPVKKVPEINQIKPLSKIEPKPELKLGRSNEALFAFDQKLKPIPDSPVNDLEFTTPDTSKKIVNVKDIKPVTNLNRFEKAYQKVVDNQYSISKFSKEADSEMTKVLASNSRNTPGTVSYILKDGLVDKTGKQIDVSFKDIVDKVPRSQEIAFDDYLLNRHNVSRMAENKPVFGEDITADISSKRMAEYEKKYPAFKEVAEQYDSFMQKFMKEWGVNSGLVSEDTWTALKEKYPNYTPTYRDKSGVLGYKGSGTKQSYANVPGILKKATGSDKPIINPLEKTMELVDKTVKAAKYNEVGQSILDDIRKDPEGLRHWAEIVEEPKEALLFDINKTLSEDGIEGIMEKFTEQFDRVFSKNKLNGSDVVRVMENGKPVYLKINDKDFFEAVTGLTTSKPGDLEKVGRFITKPLKSLITQQNPVFAVKNITRDIPTAYINGSEKNPFKFVKGLYDAAVDMKFNNEMFQEYKALGGGESNYLKNDLKKLGKESNPISKFNNFIESIPRYAEYRRTALKGGNTFEAKMKALYNANEVTTNFARYGTVTKAFDAWIPYLNASFQGLDKLVRQAKTNPGATVGKGIVAVTIPAVVAGILNEGNPHYNDLGNRIKDNYYIFPDYTNKDENGYPKTFIKLPKSREYGVMLASLFERAYRAVKKEDKPFKGFGNTVSTNFFPPTDTILQPLFNLKSNKDFADRTIVPMAMQGRSPRYQYDDQTTEISKFLGDKFNISPKQLDYLIKSYTGVVGQLGLPATTKSTYNGDARKNISKPITTQFTADPLYSNEAVNEFYENKKKLDTANKDYKFTNKEGKYYNESLRKSFSNEADTIADLYDEIREVEKSLMTSGEKQKEIERIRREILEIAKEANKLYNNQ